MNRISEFVSNRSGLSAMLSLLVAAAVGLGAASLAQGRKERERHSSLKSEVYRQSIDIMAKTLNGNLMGAVSILGLIDEDIKREARGELPPNSSGVVRVLTALAQSKDSEGAFVVGMDGIIKSSSGSGKSLTGANVGFRPYVKNARRGVESVYAAVGTTTGKRTLYFAAPVFNGDMPETPPIGAVVARGGMASLDSLMEDRADISLLLSPQNVVFAGNHAEWIGFLAARPTPELLKEIRELKQFGTMFEGKDPSVLPLATDADRVSYGGVNYIAASTRVKWNDPFGDWKLVLMEDLSRTASRTESGLLGAGAAVGAWAVLVLLLNLVRSRHAGQVSAQKTAEYARAQQATAERKTRLAATALRLQQAKSLSELAQVFLNESHPQIGTLQGLVYLAGENPAEPMRLAAGYAASEGVKPEIAPGEGLLGECALERCTRVIETPADATWSIVSGLGNTRPAALLMAPILLNEALLGVVEVALLRIPDAETRQQFEELTRILALNLEIARHSERTGERPVSPNSARDAKQVELDATSQAPEPSI